MPLESGQFSPQSAAPVVIVGAGQAGAEAALALRQGGFPGPVHLFGREAVSPYERPPLSKGFLLGTILEERLIFRSAAAYEAAGIRLVLGREVSQLDPANRRVVLNDGVAVDYAACILATGAEPRPLPVPGGGLPGILLLRSLEHARQLRAAIVPGLPVVVVGGGYLGLEVAASARKLGAEVTIIEAQPALLHRSASAITAEALASRHRAAGVRLLLGRQVARIEGSVRADGVTLAHGAFLPASLVLACIGAKPEVALAQAAGLACDDGIRVDAACRTAFPDLYAIGDCARQDDPRFGRPVRLESVQSATWQARCAAAAILGKALPTPRPAYFWSEQHDAKLQIAGLADPRMPCDDTLVGDPTGAFAVYRVQDGVLRTVEAVNRPRDFVRAHSLIGQRAVELPAA
ncbi:NAD(P)/FAD-dependent oxidoreductase [Roseomonas harenae]|uniref:NAD(P)/FAD-dependent oxidoreductase n=1 Tax=Muricoccus harenae TaxID=2692566 RepID=UPI0013311D68|nr:FAD-dependent oxidoreductase [Roseomonas harenae]